MELQLLVRWQAGQLHLVVLQLHTVPPMNLTMGLLLQRIQYATGIVGNLTRVSHILKI